jgi:integrase
MSLIHKDMAERLCDAINQDIDDKEEQFDPRDWFSSDKELRFGFAVDKWYEGKTYAPGTIPNVEHALMLAKRYFKDMNIKTIRKAHLKAFCETLTQAPTTKAQIMSWIKTALNDIVDDWHLIRIPFPRMTIPYKEQKWITKEIQDKIISQIPKQDQPIFRFMQAYGCRPSEACALMWDVIDWTTESLLLKRTFSGERYLRETTKSGYYRKVPITSCEIDFLKPLRLDIRNQFVFKNAIGNHYQRTPLWRIWKEACIKAGVEHISLKNAFRRSKATQLEKMGYPLKQISMFMGHRKEATTEIYIEADIEDMRGMV